MNLKQYSTALEVSTKAAFQGGMNLPEIMGCLELCKISVERMAFNAHMKQMATTQPPNISSVPPSVPPGN